MEKELENKEINTFEKLKNILRDNIKIFLSLIAVSLCILFGLIYFNYIEKKNNEQIAEKYITAGLLLLSEDRLNSKKFYEEVVLAKNKFYSSLALNSIIENNLENDNQKVLKLFEIVESIKMNKDNKDLIKLKKAVYLKKYSKKKEGNKLLEEIISENSTWKDTALELLK